MEEGSLRCDANISLREEGAGELGTKVEIKNLNSFKAVRDALVFEQVRQKNCLEDGEKIIQETWLWDENKGVTVSMRSKEQAQDYRYFPEPDLVPFEVSKELVETIRSEMPELPREKKKRFRDEYGFSEEDTDVLTSAKDIADLYEKVSSLGVSPQSACNWIKGEVLMHINERNTDVAGLGIKAEDLAKIIEMTDNGKISGLSAKEVLKENIDAGKTPEDIVREKGLEQVSDEGALNEVIENVISGNERSANDFKNGKANALSFLVGQVMKVTKGKANPKLAGEMLKKRLEG